MHALMEMLLCDMYTNVIYIIRVLMAFVYDEQTRLAQSLDKIEKVYFKSVYNDETKRFV